MKKLLFILFMFISTNVYANGVDSIQVNPDGVIFVKNGVTYDINYADIDATLITTQNALKVQEVIQNALDERVKRSSLPSDDPDRLADPDLPHVFWDGGDVVYRNSLATVFIEGGLFNVMLERTN